MDVHRDLKDYQGRGAQDVHLDFHIDITVQCCFTSTEAIRTIRDGHIDFQTALGSDILQFNVALRPQRP